MGRTLINKIKKNQIGYFLFKLALLIAIVFTLDFIIGVVLNYFYFKQDNGLQYRTTYSIEKTKADILIFGSSRANHHYRPDVFENRMKLSFYNAGRDGNFIFYHLAVLKGVLKRYSPKIVILDFVIDEFQQNQIGYDGLSSLLPYYRNHPEMRSIIDLKSKYERLKMLSCIYPYNSSMFTIAVGNAEFNKKRDNEIQGYVPLTKTWDGPILVENNSSKYDIDSVKVNAFKEFILECIQAKVKLYIVCSPYFAKLNHSDYSLIIGKEIAKRNNIDFFDFSKDTTFINSPKLFADIEHLNDTGASVFSNLLINSICKTALSESMKTNTTLSDNGCSRITTKN